MLTMIGLDGPIWRSVLGLDPHHRDGDPWTGVQVRQRRMKEFEKKHPSLATSVPKE